MKYLTVIPRRIFGSSSDASVFPAFAKSRLQETWQYAERNGGKVAWHASLSMNRMRRGQADIGKDVETATLRDDNANVSAT